MADVASSDQSTGDGIDGGARSLLAVRAVESGGAFAPGNLFVLFLSIPLGGTDVSCEVHRKNPTGTYFLVTFRNLKKSFVVELGARARRHSRTRNREEQILIRSEVSRRFLVHDRQGRRTYDIR